ncbi:MAG: NAD(P)/FAD-dependent oxidoreductase [Verrucomicrobiota bacterium]
MTPFPYDAVIVGGGPAGLSAALLLGRCLRRVLVCDDGRPRNAASRAMHGFLGHDGIDPAEFLQNACGQLERYESLERRPGRVTGVEKKDGAFLVRLEDTSVVSARALLLATGVRDQLPDLQGMERFYGRSLHHCPYCDAYEHRGQSLGVLGNSMAAADMAAELLLWSPEVTLFTCSESSLREDLRRSMDSGGVRIVYGPVSRLDGQGEKLEHVLMADGSAHRCDALFFPSRQSHQSLLAASLGCALEEEGGAVHCGGDGGTGIEGVFVAGNLSGGVQMAAVAAAEGVKAAAALNDWLLKRKG